MPIPLSLTHVRKPYPGWYRGDLHVHSNHSDGKHPPKEVARLYREFGLDFFVITDHNSIASFAEFGEDPGLLVLPGLEITLEEGHCNVLGVDGWRAWMEKVCRGKITIPLDPELKGVTQLLELVREPGVLTSIDHPMLAPWAWLDRETDLRLVDAIEVWNDPLWPDNAQASPRAIEFWTECLNAGLRLTAVGGSDFHCLPGERPPYPGEKPGLPMTCVYARELSGRAILEGVQARRVYVTLGPTVEFGALLDGTRFEMGADLGRHTGQATLQAAASDGPAGGTLRIVTESGVHGEAPWVAGRAALQCELALRDDRARWARAEVLDREGQMVAVTNPIFAGPAPRPAPVTFGEIARRAEG